MSSSTATALSQISCFSSIKHDQNLCLRKPSPSVVKFPSKFSVCALLDGSGTETPSSETLSTLKYGTNTSKSHAEGSVMSHPINEEPVLEKSEMDATAPEQGVTPPKKSAKIHDFCLGIPFGGLVLGGGLVGFLFSRNSTTLGMSMLYGGGLLALSTFSLKVWKQGKSSLPLILGQAALSATLLWKHFQNYALTKKLFPAGFYAVLSAAMLCFYSYVLLAGGNPPPKKLKLAATQS